MYRNYLTDKAHKKTYALKGAWLLILLIVGFIAVVVRFATAHYGFGIDQGLPGRIDAYTVAQDYIKPTIKDQAISFPESGYQCATKPDSVYIIKSYAEAGNEPKDKTITTFEITMKFNGGIATDKNNWSVININEN